MVLAVAFDDAKANRIRREGDGRETTGGISSTRFFGSRDNPDLPFAGLSEQDPGRYSVPHFHIVDQFQVIVAGKGKLGRHDLSPYSVHFSRAYTPYGPLVSDPDVPMTFFVMRAHPDPGSQSLAENEDKLKQVPNRQPWQITRQATFPKLQSGTAAGDIMLQAVSGIKDDEGLAAYTLSMKPDSTVCAPDPSHGDGQYLVVINGSLLHDDKEYKALALVFIGPKEGGFQVHAGAAGLEALVLNFPRPRTSATREATSVPTTPGYKRWQCALCSFVYDEAAGLPEEGIAPGTRWQEVPENWSCPDCSSTKGDFQMVEMRN